MFADAYLTIEQIAAGSELPPWRARRLAIRYGWRRYNEKPGHRARPRVLYRAVDVAETLQRLDTEAVDHVNK